MKNRTLEQRRRNFNRRVIGYGSIALILVTAYKWQPNRFDLIPRPVPNPNPRVDPDSERFWKSGTRFLLITAHPDDSEFFVGGTLTRLEKSGAEVHQIICTDGDKAYYPFSDSESLRKVRQAEARAAAATWGVKSLNFLGFPDGRFEGHEEAAHKLANEISRLRPDFVFAFDDAYPPRASHADHRYSGHVTVEAIESSKVHCTLLQFSTRAPNFFVDISKQWSEKAALLALHKSQFFGEKLSRIESFVMSMAMSDGEQSGVELAEGFRVTRY